MCPHNILISNMIAININEVKMVEYETKSGSTTYLWNERQWGASLINISKNRSLLFGRLFKATFYNTWGQTNFIKYAPLLYLHINTFVGELSACVLCIGLIHYTSSWNAWNTWTILLIEMKSHQGNGCELLPVKARLQAIGSPAISSWGAQMTGALFGLARQISLTTWKHLYNRNVLKQNWLILFGALPKLLHCKMCCLYSMFVNLPTKSWDIS